MKLCSIDGCEAKSRALDMCGPHYAKARRENPQPVDPEDLWQFVKKELGL